MEPVLPLVFRPHGDREPPQFRLGEIRYREPRLLAVQPAQVFAQVIACGVRACAEAGEATKIERDRGVPPGGVATEQSVIACGGHDVSWRAGGGSPPRNRVTRHTLGSATSVNARNASAKSARPGSGDTNPLRTSVTG